MSADPIDRIKAFGLLVLGVGYVLLGAGAACWQDNAFFLSITAVGALVVFLALDLLTYRWGQP